MNEFDINPNRSLNTLPTIVRFASGEISTTPHQVCRYAGGTGYKMNIEIASLVPKILRSARRLITPALVYAIYPVSKFLADGTLILQDKFSLVLPPHERDALTRYIAVVVCTIGKMLETTSHHLSKQRKFLESIFLDAAGVALTEALSERAYDLISHKAENENLSVGCRFAPGYAEMPLSNQTLLFNLVDGAAIGVKLNTRLVMDPSKSLSFFIRLTESKTFLRGEYKCELCPVSDCNFRIRRAYASQRR